MKSFTVENLACVRGGREIFAGVSFALAPGGALLVTGANGAGKSSLLRLCAGLARPAAGWVRAGRITAGGDAAAAADAGFGRALHYIGHADALKPGLSALENLRALSAIAGADAGGAALRAALKQLGAHTFADAPARALSAGQRRRVTLARLTAASRPLWLLDEPAAALDAKGAALLDELVESHRAGGGMVIMAAHTAFSGAAPQRLELGAGA